MGVPLYYFLFEGLTSRWRWLLLAGIPPVVHAVLMTYSRGAMVSLALVTPLVILRSRHKLWLTLAVAVGGRYVFAVPVWMLVLLGAAISLLGIVGDLFESLLKRSAGVKDLRFGALLDEDWRDCDPDEFLQDRCNEVPFLPDAVYHFVATSAAPRAVGLLVGDSLVRSNPLFGRGCFFAAVGAHLLRDALAASSDPIVRVADYQRRVVRELRPYYDVMQNADRSAIRRARRLLTPGYRPSLRSRLAKSFRYIVSQRLIPTKDRQGRVAAVEILKSTIRTREYVKKDESNGKSFVDAMRDGALEGMQHFDAEIERLIRGDVIDMWTGLSYATNPGNLRLQLADFQEASVSEFGS